MRRTLLTAATLVLPHLLLACSSDDRPVTVQPFEGDLPSQTEELQAGEEAADPNAESAEEAPQDVDGDDLSGAPSSEGPNEGTELQQPTELDDTGNGATDDDAEASTPAEGAEEAAEDSETPVEAEPPAIIPDEFVEFSGEDCGATPGQQQNNNAFPDPFAMNDGTRISSMAEWRCRRAEIKRDLEQFEIGPKPEPPLVQANLDGNDLIVQITTDAGSITLSSEVQRQNGEGPHCVAIGMNGNSNLINGCVQVPFMHNQVVAYAQNSNQNNNDPYYTVYPQLFGQIGNYSAWSWGISRLIDGLEQVQDELNIDVRRIGVHGCSYAGKMALFGGALDERVALTVAQESGGGGINSWRTSQAFTDRTGVNIEKIDNTNFGWFMRSMQGLNPNSLPHDHHELIAMIAPRAVIALGNPPYEWLGDESGFKSIMAAAEVYSSMGLDDSIGFDFASGHNHCAATGGQSQAVTAYVDRFLKDLDADTNIRRNPQAANFNLDTQGVINWTTPTLQ